MRGMWGRCGDSCNALHTCHVCQYEARPMRQCAVFRPAVGGSAMGVCLALARVWPASVPQVSSVRVFKCPCLSASAAIAARALAPAMAAASTASGAGASASLWGSQCVLAQVGGQVGAGRGASRSALQREARPAPSHRRRHGGHGFGQPCCQRDRRATVQPS